MIRPATLADQKQIFDLVSQYAVCYHQLRADPVKIRQLILAATSSAKHFCYVAEDAKGQIRGVPIGLTGENIWAQRLNCNALAWISHLRGDGAALLRAFRDWVRSRRAIKVAGFAPDCGGIDPRAWQLAERVGFEKHGGAYLLFN